MKIAWIVFHFLGATFALATSHQSLMGQQPEDRSVVIGSPGGVGNDQNSKIVISEPDGNDDGGGKKGKGASKQKSSGNSGLWDDSKREITYVLYSKKNAAVAKVVLDTFKEQGDFAVPISPMTRENFITSVEKSQQSILDNMQKYPAFVSVLVVAPEEKSENALQSDEAPWTYSSLPERDKNILKVFRDRVPPPSWSFMVDISKEKRCKLQVTQTNGIMNKLSQKPGREAVQKLVANLKGWRLPAYSQRSPANFLEPIPVYECGWDSDKTPLPIDPSLLQSE